MDEKKLTDEEVVSALKCLEGQYISYIDNDDDKCKLLFIDNILDLINRLQSEKAEQKSEIERLTEWKDKLQDTKDELEQQLIDTGFKEYCEENKRLTEENAELQKQVDELKEQRNVFKKLFENCNNSSNLRLSSMLTGVIILGKLLVDKLQPTAKGDKYVALFYDDCEELIKTALEKVRSEVE